MTKQLERYFLFISQAIAGLDEGTNKAYIAHLLDQHALQTSIFQHERFICLLTTCFLAVLSFAMTVIAIFSPIWQWVILDGLLLLLLGFYGWHYYCLETTLKKFSSMTQVLIHYQGLEDLSACYKEE